MCGCQFHRLIDGFPKYETQIRRGVKESLRSAGFCLATKGETHPNLAMSMPQRYEIPEAGLGHQFIADLYECSQQIADPEFIRHLSIEAARIGNATILKEVTHEFSPHGISCVLVIAESHLAVHTWPEHRYVAVDLFTCDLSVDGKEILRHFETGLKSARSQFQRVERGIASTPKNS